MNNFDSCHLVLAGPRAVGKSTIGRALSKAWSRPFIDLDDQVLASFAEPSVTQVWAIHGEDAWREAECRELEQALGAQPSIMALGGGVPSIPQAARLLNEARRNGRAFVVWLQADPGILASRLSISPGDRPSLTGAAPSEEMAQVCEARAEAYRAISDLAMDVGEGSPESIVETLASISRP